MDISNSSDDDEITVVNKKKAFKKSKQDKESSSAETEDIEEMTDVSVQRSIKKKGIKKATNNKRKQLQLKISRIRTKPPKKTSQTRLDGKYWNTDITNQRAKGSTSNNHQSLDDDLLSSSAEMDNILSSLSSESDDGDDAVLYECETFVTCRSSFDSFYLCQVSQNIYPYTKSIHIRWYSPVGEDGDDTKIGINTRFKLDYADKINLDTILMDIPDIIYHKNDNTVSLKKQHIVDTKRLLEKSIRGGSISSDDMMDLSTEYQTRKKKMSKHIHFKSSNESDTSSTSSSEALKTVSSKSNKRKKTSDKKKPPKQPAKKRQRKDDVSEVSDGENETVKPKKKTVIRKTQLFKVQTNDSLEENLLVTEYLKEPFFEDNLTVPFISSYVQSKLAIRAVLINDSKLLKNLINDLDHVCSVHVARSLHNDLTAIHYAIKTNNIQMTKILLDDIKTPKKNRCPFPTVSMTTQSTGRASIYTFGFRTAPVMASRGAKEGNNALNKDQMNPMELDGGSDLMSYALKNNCSREIYDLLFKTYVDTQDEIYDNIHKILQSGHYKLAASIIGDIKDNAYHGFNNLHHQVLLYENEDITINRSTSVIKKTRANFMITPIHCAAINPNSKYLKQLLNIMPEYNILDKYERRPIHFAAACEGPEPLEYLLSKFVNFNDVDRGGNSPLHIAVMNGRENNAEILLRTAKDKAESTAAEDQIVQEKFGLASINRMNKSRFYPLHLAVLNNHLNCVKILLQYEAYVDIPTSTSSGKLTPLMLACQKGYLNIVIYLIENGATIEARDRFKRTPLIHACMCGNADIVSYLLRLGTNANVFDSSFNTALHYAIAYGWYFCVRLLLEAGANLNCVNSWQTTCLAAGFLKGHYGLCDYLLTEHHVDINFKTDDGLTLVMLTVGLEISSAVVEQLEYVVMKHKADCTTIDANGSNAFHYLATNLSGQDRQDMDEDEKKEFSDNYFKMAKILHDNQCDPNQMNNKSQSPLMIALQIGNFILVDYLINKAKIEINSDISHDGKTLLHYFANKCDQYDLIQALFQFPINDEIKKMGQIFDNNGRTPFHYSASKFNEFCQEYKSSNGTDDLKKKYRSIVQMIEYCLQSAECDPDIEIKSVEQLKIVDEEENEDDDDDENDEEDEEKDENDEENENPEQTDQPLTTINKKSDLKLNETSVFSLLSTVPFIDTTEKHPLEIFLKKTKNPNVLDPKTHHTPLLEAIHRQQILTAQMLIHNPLCDINLSTSNLLDEQQQTPLIFACKLQLLSVINSLLEHKKCDILSIDYQNNQAIHYYLQTSNRSNEYLEILNIFIQKLKLTSDNALNLPGKSERTPLHITVYHNLGTIDAIIDIEKLLIENGSDLFIKDNLGNLPLHNVFLNKKIGDDPVELCVLILKAMKYKSIDTKNAQGNTPLHLAVKICSTVCVMLLQQHNANLLIENNLSNSILGTCIASGHLNLFITFIQQSIDINLGKLHTLPVNEESRKEISVKKKETKDIWKWKYLEMKIPKEFNQYSLIYLIIERDWQGALSLILNDISRFHLNSHQIIETAILNNKLNLVLRLLNRLKDEYQFNQTNSFQQNLFHLLANLTKYDEHLFKQILLFLSKYDIQWNIPDQYGSYPIHYACVKQNYIFINFLSEKYSKEFNLTQIDSFGNTPVGLLFWSLPQRTSIAYEKLRLLIKSNLQLDCLCNYDNEILLNPLAFNYIDSINEDIPYPPIKFDGIRTSPLIHAIVYNNFQLAKFLIELQADVNFSDENKQTPLMYAVRQNNIHLVKLLLNKTYSLNENQIPQVLAFNLGRGRGHRGRRQKFFLGATSVTNTDQTTDDQNKSEQFKLTSSINLNAADISGRTCIHYLVQPFPEGTYTNNIQILQLLHDCGISLTTSDRSGLTPLEYSIQNNTQHLSDQLIKLTNKKTTSMRKQKTIETFRINDPNENLSDTPDYYNDAQQLIDKYILSHPISKSDTPYKVDPTSGMNLTGEILIDTDKNEPYDVRLIKTDISYGIYGLYNFYRMQIIKHKSKTNLYFLFTRWGRIGLDEGQHQLTPYSTFDECQKEFCKIFREKTANSWKDTNQFESKPKKYTLIRLNEFEMKKYPHVPVDFHHLQAEHEQPPSQLHSSIYKNLIRTLINRQAIRNNIHTTQLDVKGMPASQLKREILEKARDILQKIKDFIEKKAKLNSENSHTTTTDQKIELKSLLESIHQYTNEYYTLIPLNNAFNEKLRIIEDENILKQQEKILEDLFQIELSYKILLGAQANIKYISPLDYIYKALNCQFEGLNKYDIDSQFILRYIWTSAPDIQVEQIFKIARGNENERFRKCNIGNRYLLWHGTSICNLISILTRGLLVGSIAANSTGSLFGTGIYTADTFVKSLGYCSGVKQTNDERCFMLLCEVALGNIKEVGGPRNEENEEEEEDDDDVNKPLDLQKFQSRKGIGRRIPDPKHTITRNSGVQIPLGQLTDQKAGTRGYNLNYNEYIVYDEVQVALRYLVQFRR